MSHVAGCSLQSFGNDRWCIIMHMIYAVSHTMALVVVCNVARYNPLKGIVKYALPSKLTY